MSFWMFLHSSLYVQTKFVLKIASNHIPQVVLELITKAGFEPTVALFPLHPTCWLLLRLPPSPEFKLSPIKLSTLKPTDVIILLSTLFTPGLLAQRLCLHCRVQLSSQVHTLNISSSCWRCLTCPHYGANALFASRHRWLTLSLAMCFLTTLSMIAFFLLLIFFLKNYLFKKVFL